MLNPSNPQSLDFFASFCNCLLTVLKHLSAAKEFEIYIRLEKRQITIFFHKYSFVFLFIFFMIREFIIFLKK